MTTNEGSPGTEPLPVTRTRLAWLGRESARWRDAGTIDDRARDRILAGYEVAPLVRGTLLLVFLAVLTFGVGVLLLIGYNWDRITTSGKVTLILSAVAASFAASAVAYARERPAAGEVLAVFGTLLFGNGIWLLAQVLHISGYFPDAYLWFAIGAGVSAFLLRSRVIGVETAILVVAWVFASGAASPRPEYWFLALWPGAILLAYRLRSAIALAISAFAAPLWVFVTTVQLSPRPVFLGAAALAGCALFAIGDWHQDENRMKPAWQIAGLFPLLLMFIPLLATQVHRDGGRAMVALPATVLAMISIAGVIALTLLRRKPHDAATAAVIVVAAALLTWTALLAGGVLGGEILAVLAATMVFSVLALLLSASFIRTALRTNDPYEFGFGVLFAIVFLVVRWTSVIDNMFLSGMVMIGAGAALLMVARLWRHRDQGLALHGRMS